MSSGHLFSPTLFASLYALHIEEGLREGSPNKSPTSTQLWNPRNLIELYDERRRSMNYLDQ